MAASAVANRPWNLGAFLDSLVVELDRARDTLAVKALTRPLSYSVQDVGMEVQVFPQYDGDQVRFVTAQPGEEGASGLKIQLGSITSRGIKETTSEPPTRDDVAIDQVEGIDEDAKASLRKLGVKSLRDLERMEERNVNIEQVTGSKVDYGALANVINRARRRAAPPKVTNVGVAQGAEGPLLAIRGDRLDIAPSLAEFPVARLNGARVGIATSSPNEVQLAVDPRALRGRRSRLEVALDPFAVVSMELEA